MNWLDYVLIFLFVFSLYKGIRQGLVQQVIGLAIFFIALFFSLSASETVIGFLDSSFQLQEILINLEENGDTPVWLVQVLLNIIAFLLAFLVISSLLSFLTGKLKLVNKIPLIGPVNALSGAFVGAIKGILVVFVVMGLLSLLETDFWVHALESSAIYALSYHYMAFVFLWMLGWIAESLGFFL